MNDLRAALRSLLSTPGPTLVVVVTLAIAIGANTAIFSVVEGVLLRPLGYDEDHRLAMVWATHASDPSGSFRLSPADYRDLRDTAESFGGQVALYRSIGSTLTGLDEPVQVGSYAVTPRLFDVLGAEPAVGRLFDDTLELPGGPNRVVLTYSSWQRHFSGDPAIVGQTIELDSDAFTVIGVAEPDFIFPPGDTDVAMYFPMAMSDTVLLDRNHRMFDSVARLADGVALASAREELDAIATQLAQEFPDSNEGWGLTVRTLREELIGDLTTTLAVLSAAVVLALLVACANIANVLVARSAAAGREFAVRAAMGARARELARRSLTESVLLGAVGGGAGVLLALWGTALLERLMPAEITRVVDTGVDASTLLLAALLSIGAAVLFGSVPAVRSMTPDLAELLKPSGAFGAAGAGGRRWREVMVTVEVALAIVLLVGAGLMVRSFARMSSVDPGFRSEGVTSISVKLPRTRHEREAWLPFYEQLVDEVAALPGVRAAGAVSDLPMSSVGLGMEMEFTIVAPDGQDPTARPNADFRLVVPGYFESMGMRIVSGRNLERLDARSDQGAAVVNETLVARYFPGVDPLGQRIRVAMLGDVEIVGVVSDVRHGGLQSKYESEMYVPYGRIATAEMHVVVHSDLDPATVAAGVTDTLQRLDPQLAPSSVAVLSDLLWASVAQPRFNTALLAALALCAAVLAVVGTYGIVAYSVTERVGEIGIRMALGASSGATVWMVVRQALVVVMVGAALGVVASFGLMGFLRQLLFDVQPTDPVTYAAVVVAALVVGAVAAWLPARRATRIDPVAALRDE